MRLGRPRKTAPHPGRLDAPFRSEVDHETFTSQTGVSKFVLFRPGCGAWDCRGVARGARASEDGESRERQILVVHNFPSRMGFQGGLRS